MKIYIVLLFFFATLFLACVKDEPKIKVVEPAPVATLQPVFVLNEGNYSAANAGLTYYNVNDNSVIEDYYRQQNKTPIGDVLQSMLKFENKFYLVVNNSNKIVVCDTALKKISQITGLTSPRYMLPINSNKAYVSDLFANQIHIIDLKTNSKIGFIPCVGWTEQMQLINNKVFVCNVNSAYLFVIDVLTDKKIDSVLVGKNASSCQLDKHQNLWVLSGGEKEKGIAPQLNCVSTLDFKVIKRMPFVNGETPSNLNINKSKDTLYFLNKGVFRLAIQDQNIPTQALIPQNNRNFYGLGIHPNNYNIYVSDALDYIQKSNCYIYNAKGEQLKLFKAGINAGAFYFE